MQKIEQRIAALEKAQPHDDAVTTIFVLPLPPGESDWNCARTRDGARTWARAAGESVAAFKARIAAASKPPQVQLVVLDTEPPIE